MRLPKKGVVLLLTLVFSVAATWLPIPFPSTGWKPWVGTSLWESVVFFGYLFLESEFESVRQLRQKTKHYVVLIVVFLVFGGLGVGFFMLFASQEEKGTRNIAASDTLPEPDTAELANTTRFQEALIIDTYHHIAGAERKGEVYALYEKIMRLDNPLPFLQKLSETSEIEDLIKRGILQQNPRLAEKTVVPLQGATRTVVVGNVHLTRKGTSLARDLLYVREHPEINLFRPIEP